MIKRPVRPAAIVAALVVAAAGCGGDDNTEGTASSATAPAASYPLDVTSCGRTSTFERAPERVVVGFPSTIATLVALGVGDRVTGYTSGGLAPAPSGVPEAKELSPDYQAPREVVLAADADLFVTNDENQFGGADGGVSYDDLDGAGTATYVLGGYCMDGPALSGIDTVYEDVTNLGAIFGVPDRAAEVVNEMRDRIAAARARLEGPALDVAVVQVYDGKLYALSGAYYGIVLTSLGLGNEFAGIDANFAEISKEQVLTRDPDALLVIYDTEDTKAAQVAEATELLAGSTAARDGRVVGLRNADVSAGGVSIAGVIEETATALAG